MLIFHSKVLKTVRLPEVTVFFAAINGKFTKQLQFFCCRVSETSRLDIYWFRMMGLNMVLLRIWNAKMVASSIRETHIIWDAECQFSHRNSTWSWTRFFMPRDLGGHAAKTRFSRDDTWVPVSQARDTCAVKRPTRITSNNTLAACVVALSMVYGGHWPTEFAQCFFIVTSQGIGGIAPKTGFIVTSHQTYL